MLFFISTLDTRRVLDDCRNLLGYQKLSPTDSIVDCCSTKRSTSGLFMKLT